MMIILVLVFGTTSIDSVKATNEGSYIYGKWEGSNTGPQHNSTQNNYPEYTDNTCSLSNSSTYSGIIIPAVTNKTACQNGFFSGYKVWCSAHTVNCVGNVTMGIYPPMIELAHKQYQMGYIASNGSYSVCPIGNSAVFCLGWNDNLGERAGECGDNPLANITRFLVGCPEDIMTVNQLGGYPALVGKWNFVNQSQSGAEITGTFVFNNDGSMEMTVPSKTGFGSYVLQASWGTPYFSYSHHVVTFVYIGENENNTLTEISPNHIEFIDIHHNIIHLMRYHALPPFTLQLVPPQRNATLLYQQGSNQADLKNWTGALAIYQKALAIEPKNVNVLADMGRVLYGLKNNTGTLQYLDKALSLNSSNVYALSFKGFILNELGHYKEALVYLDRALELTPPQSFYDINRYHTLNTKGVALMKSGDYIDALSTFDTAINAQSYMDEAHYDKAFLLTTLGFHTHNTQDLNTALENVNEAIKFNSDNTKAQALKGLLMQILGGLR
jgi:Tfp pilus assembly protein PilF